MVARVIDAVFRGLSRGMAAKTFTESLIKLAGSTEDKFGNFVIIPVFLLTTYTSYVGTRWWTDNYEKLNAYALSNQRSCLLRAQRLMDAFFRGIARAEATTNAISLIGTLWAKENAQHDFCISASSVGFLIYRGNGMGLLESLLPD